jgi:PAS domain S-box-containing protein
MRHTGSARVAIPLVIVVLSVAGYAVATRIVDAEQRDAADRRAETDALQIQRALEQARAFSVGLANALQSEPRPEGRRFAALQGSATTTVGLTTAIWLESVGATERRAYERRTGTRITRLPGTRPTRRAASYLPATFITGGTLPAGVDMSGEHALASTLRNPASVFAGTASPVGSLGGRRGFFLVQGARFGRGPGSRGYLVVFVPAAWPSASISQDPDQIALSLDGRSLDGAPSTPAASWRFDALARRWQVDVAAEPATGLLEALPWLALIWLPATALIAYLVGRGIVRRRRAERQVDDIFDLSLDLLCTAGLDDGYLKRMNPAFERTLGYHADELLSRPFIEFVHPEDRARTIEAVDSLRAGRDVVAFENRFLQADGGVSWLQWNTRPSLDRGLMYAAARDVTHAHMLVGEQAALRRVATLVAQGAPASQIFDGVARETRQMLDADASAVLRLESDGTVTPVALDSTLPSPVTVGERVTPPPAAARAIRTDSSVRGEIDPRTRELVSAPITVGGRVWGVVVVTWAEARAIPPDAEARLDQFKELIATAVANAESRAQLVASRARVVATADETRRRIERDLHDGAQQRLVHTVVTLKLAERALDGADGEAREFVAEALRNAQSAIDEVRELARGIHPRILSRGFGPALHTLARRCPVPVTLDVREAEALPELTDVTAYYVVSEALTNTARHAHASQVWITVDVDGSWLHLTVRDDGVGGADPSRGSGLRGLRDRVEALGGALDVRSERGEGTVLKVRIPVEEPAAAGVDV